MENGNKFQIQKIIALFVAIIGLVLLVFMIVIEDEPGAIPLGMILIGSIWFILINKKLKSIQSR